MADFAATAVLLGLIFGSLTLWATILSRVASGKPVLAQEPRPPVPWQVWDVLAVVMIYWLLQFGGLAVALMISGVKPGAIAEDPTSQEAVTALIPMLLASGCANLGVVVLATLILCVRVGATWRDLGLQPCRPLRDTGLGLLAFLAAMAPVYAIQWVLTQFFPSQHPVATLLTNHPDPLVLLVCGFTAVLVAPVAEEFLFRVVLQGWMERVEAYWRAEQGIDTTPTIIESGGSDPQSICTLDNAIPAPGVADDGNPYRSPLVNVVAPASLKPPNRGALVGRPASMSWLAPGTLPIICSSAAFALMHLGHGPDPIPLFVLALILGYLYHRTHRLWPCVVVHMTLNACSLAALWLSVMYGSVR